ncbi:MAG: DUF4232 domain-containing protein [Nakamurella sp.]
MSFGARLVQPSRIGHGISAAAALGVVLVATGCAVPDARSSASAGTDSAGTETTTSSKYSTSGNGMRSGVFPTTRVEPPTAADRQDGPPATPDAALTAAELAALIRVTASAPPVAGRCSVGQLRLSLGIVDAAAGHRYSQVVATNTGRQSCTLTGWPGLGFRGSWGTAFPVIAARATTQIDWVDEIPADPRLPVTVAPGGRAGADLEWTGALAGNREERVSLIAVQLATGGPAMALPVPTANQSDLGAESTVQVGRWRPVR